MAAHKTVHTNRISGFKWFLMARLFPLSFLLPGAVMLFIGLSSIRQSTTSIDWPKAPGKVLSSSIKSSGYDTDSVYAEVLYEFQVNGTVVQGNRVAFGDYSSSDGSHAKGIVDRYPVGEEVTVFYNKDNPEECLLEPGLPGQIWLLPGAGLVFFASGVFLFLIVPRLLAKAEQSARLQA